jgi:hypothetical protein
LRIFFLLLLDGTLPVALGIILPLQGMPNVKIQMSNPPPIPPTDRGKRDWGI